MTVVFTFWGHLPNRAERDAIKFAVARSGCPVIVISDEATRMQGVEWVDIASFLRANAQHRAIQSRIGPYKWKAPTIARWLVLRDFLQERRDISYPIFHSDWDVLLFTPLAESYAPFFDCDYAISSYSNGGKLERSAAYAVNNFVPLEFFCELVGNMLVDQTPWGDDVQDMRIWSMIGDRTVFKVGNLFEVIDGGVFDHNIAVSDSPSGKFVCDKDGYKAVGFTSGMPWFLLESGYTINAHSIHAWGNWKTKTGELLKLAGIS